MTLDLLIQYLARQTTAAHSDAVRRWLSENPANAAVLASLARVVGRAPVEVEHSDAATVWQRIASRLDEAGRPVELVREAWPLYGRSRARVSTGVAAALVLAIGAGAVWLATAPGPDRLVVSAAPAPVAAPVGQRVAFRLPDGTAVMLAPGSTLRPEAGYGGRERLVHLDGEAAFTVTHDSTRPFVVRTRYVDARDLGTRFLVRAHPGDSAAEIVVADGKVAVRDSLLTAGELGRVTAMGPVVVRRGVALERYFSWTQGRLVFLDTPLREAAAELARWYDIDIRFSGNTLGDLPLTVSFDDDTAIDALRLIAVTLDLRLGQRGRTYTLAPK